MEAVCMGQSCYSWLFGMYEIVPKEILHYSTRFTYSNYTFYFFRKSDFLEKSSIIRGCAKLAYICSDVIFFMILYQIP